MKLNKFLCDFHCVSPTPKSPEREAGAAARTCDGAALSSVLAIGQWKTVYSVDRKREGQAIAQSSSLYFEL